MSQPSPKEVGMPLIGLLGGTFNPIHIGHLRLAQEISDALNFDEMRFIPSANPPHKTAPEVSAEHRANMVQLAIVNNSLFKLDTRELSRKSASYTIDTLISMRKELGKEVALCLMMGSDAFVHLNTWHRWQELLNYCHIILVQRPTTSKQPKLAGELARLLEENYTENGADLSLKTSGYIHMQAITALDISSTNIRTSLKAKQSARYLVLDEVLDYIKLNHLYQ
jgi:nicotinate-nucleotide adenylyltransferase